MAQQIVELTCPGCGARVTTSQTECEWCHAPVVIYTFNSVYSMSVSEVNKYAGVYKKALSDAPDDSTLNNSIAMCYLKLKLYDKALVAFEQAIDDDFDNSETYFYAAACLLGGKKAFVQQRSTIDKIIEYINAAIMIEPRGIYYYFLAYIKYDFFERKYLNVSPNYKSCLSDAITFGTSEYDKNLLFEILGVVRPNIM